MDFRKVSVLQYLALAFATILTLPLMVRGDGAGTEGKNFPSPRKAAQALVEAVETRDLAGVFMILGSSSEAVFTTADPVADKRARDTFIQRAKEKMRVVADPNHPSRRILEIGNDQWPFPIPIVQASGSWHFDLEQGKEEILLRRIGDNELTAISVCRGYVEAQDEYFSQIRPGQGVRQFAQKFISSPGKHDGLYWPSTDPKDESPIGEMVAHAVAEGYTTRSEPYHGYYFKILASQGPNASGGALDYVKDGAMTRGFALIAWPAEYKSTGVMTFLVNKSGIVYQKDLGEKSSQIAAATSAYNPDPTWVPVSAAIESP
jgi:hypothetical protein